MRVGVLGMGRWGRTLIGALDRHAEVVIACNTGGRESQAWLREAFPHVRAGSDARQAIDDRSLDAVVVATPIATHAALATEALTGGHHVFVEKPIAMSPTEARAVVAMAKDVRRVLFTGHTFLFDEGLEWLGREVESSRIRAVRTVWHKHGTFGEPLVWNLLPHDLAILMSLCGSRPTTISVEDARAGETDLDALALTLDLDGIPCRIEIDRTKTERVRRVEIDLHDGSRFDWTDGVVDRHRGGNVERMVEPTEPPLDREVRAFVEACSGRGVPTGATGPFATQVVEAVHGVLEQMKVPSRPRAERTASGMRS